MSEAAAAPGASPTFLNEHGLWLGFTKHMAELEIPGKELRDFFEAIIGSKMFINLGPVIGGQAHYPGATIDALEATFLAYRTGATIPFIALMVENPMAVIAIVSGIHNAVEAIGGELAKE